MADARVESGVMRARTRRWALAALLGVGVEGALILGAGVVLGVSSWFHASALGWAGTALAGVAAILPADYVAAVGAVLGALGAGRWQALLVAPALAGTPGAGLPALGGVLAAPVYTVARRSLRGKGDAARGVRGPPPHRASVAAMAKPLEPVRAPSTGVQESL